MDVVTTKGRLTFVRSCENWHEKQIPVKTILKFSRGFVLRQGDLQGFHPFSSGRNRLDAAICIIFHRFGYDRAAVTGAGRQTAIMADEYPLSFEVHDGRMGCVAVSGYF